jgi:geranylgeranyl diphosphate synthase type I
LEKNNKINKLIEEDIQKALATINNKRLYEVCSYSLFPGGKRIRPLVFNVFYEELGGTQDRLSFGTAIELLHTASLIHDDIIDKDVERRGKASVHIQFGVETAILAGDVLQALAFEWSDETHLLASSYRTIMEGQASDANQELGPRELARKKTSPFFECALVGAAKFANQNHLIESAKRAGTLIGEAFQLVDDLIDRFGDSSDRGRKDQSDKEKKTFADLNWKDIVEEINEANLLYEFPKTKSLIAEVLSRFKLVEFKLNPR